MITDRRWTFFLITSISEVGHDNLPFESIWWGWINPAFSKTVGDECPQNLLRVVKMLFRTPWRGGVVISPNCPNVRGFDDLYNFDRLHRLFVDSSSLCTSLGLWVGGGSLEHLRLARLNVGHSDDPRIRYDIIIRLEKGKKLTPSKCRVPIWGLPWFQTWQPRYIHFQYLNLSMGGVEKIALVSLQVCPFPHVPPSVKP